MALLFLANLLYCHRLYGVFFPLEGDALYHIYFRLNESVLKSGQNPFQWYFTDLMSFTGNNNPVLWFSNIFISLFSPTPLVRAILTNMLTAFLCSFLLSLSMYFFFSYTKFTRAASVLGAIVVAFTGLHLSGIREFDYVFQYSFIFVPLVLISYLELVRRTSNFKMPFIFASLCLGASFWGGGNVPMFFFLPLFIFLPFAAFYEHRSTKLLLQHLAYMAGSLVVAFGIGAVAIFPTAGSLQYSNRVEIQFDHIARSLSPFLKLQTLFLRDWVPVGIIHYHERDYFLGLPTLILTLLGLSNFQKLKNKTTFLMVAFLFASIVVTHYTFLPDILASPIGRFYDLLSIRNSNRFFLLGLFPAAYFAAYGFDRIKGTAFPFIAFLLLLLTAFLVQTSLIPVWDRLLPDTILASSFSLFFAFCTTVLLFFKWILKDSKALNFLAVFALFLMFYAAPIQLTNYLPHYFNDRALLEKVPSDRLTLSGFFGFKWNYEKVWNRADSLFIETPGDLLDPRYQKGRILDVSESDPAHGRFPNFFAPQTNHQFAFTLVDDHLSSMPMQELYRLGSNSVLDLNSVCWIRDLSKSPTVTARPSCLPKAFFVSRALPFPTKSHLLQWLQRASTQEMQSGIGINCSVTNCSQLGNFSGGNGTVSLTERPGHFTLEVNATSDGYIFLSSHYRKDWEAFVNGKKVEVLPANHAFMAVPVPPGNSVIELRLTWMARVVGKWISLLTLLCTLAITFWAERNSIWRYALQLKQSPGT